MSAGAIGAPAGVAADAFARGGAQESSWYGDHLPERDFPMLSEPFPQGAPPLEKPLDEEISLDDLDAAFAQLCRGEVLRSVVTFC